MNLLNIHNSKDHPRFYGRRKGRKLSKSGQLAIKHGAKYLIKKENLPNLFDSEKCIVLEIGSGDGENLINSAKANSKIFYIGADPFINTTAKCLNKLIINKLKNVGIWPDDIRKIINLFPQNSISEIKMLFPDPWPKKKHQNRRLIQNEFIETIYTILKPNGTITIATDHDILKNWILEKFQSHRKLELMLQDFKDWEARPQDCFETKYELKSIMQKRKPCWFIFKKN